MAIRNFTDLAYSKSVKAMQLHLGTRDRNAELEREARNTEVTESLSAYLAERTSILIATSSKSGWPYVQHRGGPKGFVRTLDRHTIAFADYPGNKQYITLGNLAENPKATICHRSCRTPAREDLGRGGTGGGRSRLAGLAAAAE
jgi:predicted pyridoxine 5'-phosphate oxidase superfamily flavin-nucleotide-binding protein